MHFITFVAVKIGRYTVCKEIDNAIKKQIEVLSQCEPESICKKVSLKCRIEELKSLTNSFARAVNAAVESRLEPYCECTEDKRFLKFFDETENIKQEYESGEDCIKLSNGTVQSASELCNKFYIKNGLVYQKNFGPLKQEKRSKRAKKMLALPQYPFKKRYKTLEEFAENYCGLDFYEKQNAYGYYANPNSFWDWYRIGGRWPCAFLVKADCEEYAPGNYDEDYDLPNPPEGYKWTSAARKKDIEWQVLIAYKKKVMQERFEFYRNAFEKKELPKKEWFLRLADDGIYNYENNAVYLAGESFDENQSRRKYCSDTDYLSLPCYYVDKKYWHCKEGWWINSENNDAWKEEVKKFYNSLADDTILVSVDCHD